jgi:hypothetical protein
MICYVCFSLYSPPDWLVMHPSSLFLQAIASVWFITATQQHFATAPLQYLEAKYESMSHQRCCDEEGDIWYDASDGSEEEVHYVS